MTSPPEPVRSALRTAGPRLSYLDHGGPGRPLLALHGHFGEARCFTRLARELAPDWRVIALDQRGHGLSDSAADVTRAAYVADAVALSRHLGLGPAVLLGHSLGGVNAYQLAARHPELAGGLVVVDVGAEIQDDLACCLAWPERAPTRAALLAALGAWATHAADSVREFPDGWGLSCRAADMVASQRALNGDHWADWLAGDCPALLVRGAASRVLRAGHARLMASRRPGTQLAEVAGAGHAVHTEAPAGFAAAVRTFLAAL